MFCVLAVDRWRADEGVAVFGDEAGAIADWGIREYSAGGLMHDETI